MSIGSTFISHDSKKLLNEWGRTGASITWVNVAMQLLTLCDTLSHFKKTIHKFQKGYACHFSIEFITYKKYTCCLFLKKNLSSKFSFTNVQEKLCVITNSSCNFVESFNFSNLTLITSNLICVCKTCTHLLCPNAQTQQSRKIWSTKTMKN